MMKVRLVCDQCGADIKPDGRYINHRSRTQSFLVYNANQECPYCPRE